MTVRVVLVHASADLYGSDRQLAMSAQALVERGWDVVVVLPRAGPLVVRLRSQGVDVRIRRFPVIRKSSLSLTGVAALLGAMSRTCVRDARWLRGDGPDVVLVNTITIPSWIAAARLARVPVLCHVHEAENRYPWAFRAALVAPLLMCRRVVANSVATRDALVSAMAPLARRTRVVHNGVRGPSSVRPPRPRSSSDALELVQVGRLSLVKGSDISLEAVAAARATGRDVRLTYYGSVFTGNEGFLRRLQDRAVEPDLAGAVVFAGQVDEPWSGLERADAVLVPSRMESFGNAAVEALLADRPVIVSDVQGLREVVPDERTGLRFSANDPAALARAIVEVHDDPVAAARRAAAGRQDALRRFGTDEYRDRLVHEVVRTVQPAAIAGDT